MHGKLMREALNEVRSFRDTTEGGPGSGPQKGGKKFSSSEIKKAYGILNDPRYKQGNYTGAAKAINKLAPGLADHPDVKNAMKRANENLDLPATGDTTTSNASQEVEQVEDLKEYTGMGNLPKSVNSNDVATALKNLKKGTKLQVSGKPQGGMRTMGTVLSVSGDTVKIKPTASNGPTSVKVKDITMMDVFKEEAINEFKLKDSDIEKLKQGVKQMPPIKGAKLGKPQKVKAVGEAKFTPAQVSALQKAYGQIGPGGEKNAMRMDQLARMMGKYSKSHLSQLADMDIPMVSKVAKELMKEELDEASRLRPLNTNKGLYSMTQMKQQVARTEKAFNEFKQHCDFIFQMDRDIGPSMGDNSGKYFDVYSDLDDANKLIKKALADAKKIT